MSNKPMLSPETHRIEFKRELTPELDLEKEVIAFLNTPEGGFIYLGIDKNGQRMGVASGSEKPYAKKKYGLSEKGCFLRIGTAAEPMPTAMIERLFANRTRNSIGKIKAHRQALSFEQLRIYFEEKRKPLGRQFKTNLELTTEDGALNYAAYLMADENGMSIKVAKYQGKDRVHLIESNDYSREVPPKFEIFADHIEITSACALPEGLTQAEFFEGYSIPRNKELMRVFKDLEMVEHLGSGLPRITEFYGPECFRFTDNFLRITFAASRAVHEEETAPVTTQVTTQVKQLLFVMTAEHSRQELQTLLGLANREHFRKAYLIPALAAELIEPTLPDKPNSRLQQYRVTEQGKALLK